ncbi:Polysaccharide deacetylase [Flexibacter flexilis DSM 6793]|uniref:Polysaccharide deacetylase n=1 Tax=Flexibacter flexilis DSM 6793 TaxID=927664 RepID=A0A1I1DH19_9BACT|nr:polysaccharide deacetylase family protein [Flexibacter flexilis]SFB73706.1 Polysaccharide deacetylase [Flexibacter flexilis DSM 6793]
MKSTIYKISFIATAIPIRLLASVTGQKAIFPFYHLISDDNVAHIKHLYPVRSTKAFEKDLDFFLKNYNPVELDVFFKLAKSGKFPKKNIFLLTFDDGLSQFYDVIAPILQRKGVPAICFLNSAFIDNKDLFFRYKASLLIDKIINKPLSLTQEKEIRKIFVDNSILIRDNTQAILSIDYAKRSLLDDCANILALDFSDYLNTQKPYLSSNQIQELRNKGFEFGAHSIDHPLYSQLDQAEQIRQTKISVNDISESFNIQQRLFSFPFSDVGVKKDFFDTIFDTSHSIADITFGCSGLKKDICNLNIQRIPIEIEQFSAKQIVYGEYWYYILKMLVNKNVLKR